MQPIYLKEDVFRVGGDRFPSLFNFIYLFLFLRIEGVRWPVCTLLPVSMLAILVLKLEEDGEDS
jgi:hypothetical protein